MRILVLFFLFVTLSNACENPFPERFKLKEKACLNMWHNTVTVIEENGDEIAEFESVCPSWNQDVNLVDNEGEQMGRTDKQTVRWGTKIDLYDCDDEIFAVVKEGNLEVVLNQVKIDTSYNIYAADGEELIGYSDKNEILDTEFIIRNLDGTKIAHSKKTVAGKFGSSVCIDPEWEMTFYNTSNPAGDQRILSFITALKAVQDISDEDGTDTCTSFYLFAVIGGPIIGCILLIGCIFLAYKFMVK